MRKNCNDYEAHDFYCINCGCRGIPLSRAGNKKRKQGHRKLMYCYHCRHTVNHVECRTAEEVEKFQEDFAKGTYREEAEQELLYERETPQLSTLLA